jgi:hypothetical protein
VIQEEVARMAAEAQGTSWSAGRSIYKQACFCINPARLYHADANSLLDDWRMSHALGVPIAATLDQVPAMYAEAALVIDHEMAHIRKAQGGARG